MPLSKFAWLNPVNVIHSFILPKATGKKAWETKHDLCPQRATRQQHKVHPGLQTAKAHNTFFISLSLTRAANDMNRVPSEFKQDFPTDDMFFLCIV